MYPFQGRRETELSLTRLVFFTLRARVLHHDGLRVTSRSSRGLVCNGERTRSLAGAALTLASHDEWFRVRPVTIMRTL